MKRQKGNKTKRQKYREGKKRVIYYDVRAVSHSCDVFAKADQFRNLGFNPSLDYGLCPMSIIHMA